MGNVETNKELFKSIVYNNIHREGIDDLMDWLETTDFYVAPASTRFHGTNPGDLVAHSLEVYSRLKMKQTTESDETIALVSLFHDLCKANFYEVSLRNTKDENGKWIQVPFYTCRQDDPIPLGHGEKSMFILMQHMKLSVEEASAIRWHMGGFVVEPQYEKPSLNSAMRQFKLVILLNQADTEASFLSGK